MLIPQINFSTNRAAPLIPAADLALPSPGESAALGHYLFGPDVGSLGSIADGAGSLTVQSAAPAYSANYLDVTSRNALLTSLPLDATAPVTICMVLRIPAASLAGIGLLMGNLSNPIANGRALYASGGALTFRAGGAAGGNLGIGVTLSADTWYFIGLSHNPTVTTGSVKCVVGAVNTTKDYNNSGAVAGAVKLALGDPTYASLGSKLTNIAEGITFNSALSVTDMQAIYTRSKIRMSGRGIALG